MSTYKCKHFIIQQLIPPEIFLQRGELAWELLEPRLLVTLDELWDAYGEFVVNDWHEGGSYKESGLRGWDTKTGARLSQHKFGRATDNKPKKLTPREMYEDIRKDPTRFQYLTVLEDIVSTPSWVHTDVRNTWSLRIIKV